MLPLWGNKWFRCVAEHVAHDPSPPTDRLRLCPRTRRPLQWAVQNKHDACVKLLMELYPESAQMNVLDTNGFGKSALSDVSAAHLILCVFPAADVRNRRPSQAIPRASLMKHHRPWEQRCRGPLSAPPIVVASGQGRTEKDKREQQGGLWQH